MSRNRDEKPASIPIPSPTTTQIRPWGTVTLLEDGKLYRINRIEVKPGHQISPQMHHHRSEHWVVVSGTARVVCGGKDTIVTQNQSTYVPNCTPHRLENPGVIPLVMIEVQNGEYLGEDDIIRLQEGEEGQVSAT
ncbi:phosphomannose isomerase type II C-terminal cupin domain [Leptolyngbya sp. FACHB-261]|uniref:phosphomannose isomerase type II C-terminal cupin domain n=1 Tax=Leptolyngbya sp. FACHB-261 TaxID=2692806 RepID=UPI0016820EB6|nr:phosphomannose isomerase type II C-terminal cupin domain [Leptolyngbya sp. FACHB-261]MBD2101544.1 phosphomannose isomerase type II C-terminal cupin domain [Leptolyngbya sp. FACHB-261]